MAENLNNNAQGSRCYEDDVANCAKDGRLYDWESAMTACPCGWHLPSAAEWDYDSYMRYNCELWDKCDLFSVRCVQD